MATSVLELRHNIVGAILFNNSTGTDVATSDTTIQLTRSYQPFTFLVFVFNNQDTIVPVIDLANARHYPVGVNGVINTVRIGYVNGDETKVRIMSTSAASLVLTRIYGIG